MTFARLNLGDEAYRVGDQAVMVCMSATLAWTVAIFFFARTKSAKITEYRDTTELGKLVHDVRGYKDCLRCSQIIFPGLGYGPSKLKKKFGLLLRGSLSPLQRLCPQNLLWRILKCSTCLCLKFLKIKFAKRERAGICRRQTWTPGSRITRLTAWTICKLTNAGGKRLLKPFRWLHVWTTGISTVVANARYVQMRRKSIDIRAKCHNSKVYMSWSLS